MKRPHDINSVESDSFGTVTIEEHRQGIKKAKKKSFAKGSLFIILLVGLVAGATYLVSGFGNQYEYQLVEPDYNLPELKEDIIKEEGNLESGDVEVETVDE